MFCQYFPQELCITHGGEEKLTILRLLLTLSLFSSTSKCRGKVFLAVFSMYDSFPSSQGPGDICLLVL